MKRSAEHRLRSDRLTLGAGSFLLAGGLNWKLLLVVCIVASFKLSCVYCCSCPVCIVVVVLCVLL